MTRVPSHRPASGGILGEPRGRILAELCGHPHTALELAERAGTSGNAVRVHLEALRAAGLVTFTVERRGVGKPTHVYSLTSEAEYLLSAAYAPALRAVLGAVRTEQGSQLGRWLHAAGARLEAEKGSRPPRAAGSVQPALDLLRALGAAVSLERHDTTRIVRASCCPLGSVTRGLPDACQLLEGALAAALPAHDVREQCERGDHPHCVFAISPASAGHPSRRRGGPGSSAPPSPRAP